MAEFDQVFDDFGDTMSEGVENVKDFVKEKPFVVAVVIVAAVALFVAWKRSRETVETTNETATFYTYPTTGGGVASFQGESTSDSMYYDLLEEINRQDKDYQDALTEIEKSYSDSLNELDKQYGSQFSELESNLSKLQNQNTSLSDQINKNQAALNKSSVMNQMEANSDLWHLTSDPEERKRLEAENQALGASIGLTYNAGEGSWYEANGTRAYETALQSVQGRTSSNTKKSGTMTNNKTYTQATSDAAAKAVTYDKNVDYQAKINDAKASGASQAVIDGLTAQRNAKIAGEYGGVDPDTVKKK